MGMSNPASPNCPQCGAALPAGAPGGLCPRCLMALNLKTETIFTDDSPAAQPPLPPDQIAPHFPQLEILECLGRGGMGVVYKARQKTLNRFVALKLLAPERVHDAKFAERFAREAQALAALNHPNIVTIHDFGQAGGFYFLLMEFVDGVNLRQLLRARKFTPEEALAIVPPLCDALQFAHERGIVHRDIKPENLLLDKTGRVKVADFGIAKMLGNGARDPSADATALDNATKTALGTPGYSAPEQKSDPQRVDSRADIYSLGVVFYEMLTGELPGKSIEPPSRKVQIDVRLDQVVLRALAKTPELRFQQASEVKTCVETIAGSPPVSSSGLGEADLNRQRLKVVIWGLILTLACFLMGENTTPATYGHFIESFGFTLVLLSVVPLVLPGDRVKRTRTACRNLSFNGIFTATAALWCATHNPMLPEPWLIAIAAGCLGAIVYCLACLRRSLRHNSVPPPDKFGPRFLRWLTFEVPAAILILLILRTFILQPFRTPTDAAAPELPRGSHFMVWKLARNFAPGDLIVYHYENWNNVGRVTGRANDGLVVNRNAQSDVTIPYGDIIGKVFSVYWRASNSAVPSGTPDSFIGQALFPLGDFIEITSIYRTHDQMVIKGHYHLVSQDQALLALNLTATNAGIDPLESSQQMPISKGWGDFNLTHNHLVPGLPHVSMYNHGGLSFANLYFGNATEVTAERNLDLRSAPGGNHRLEHLLPSAGPWTNWNSQPEIGGFYAVAATTNETVAAGIHGLVATRSATTGAWQTQTLAGGRDFRGVAYAHGQYVAVSEGGALLTSPDGLTWTSRDSTVTNNLLGVFWDGQQYLVGGDRGTLLTSPDGINWSRRTSGTQIHLSAFSYSGTRYVAAGNDGIIISDDALTWRKPANWVEVARVPFTACTWTGSEFVACGLGLGSLPTIYTSPDGETWTLRETTLTTSFRAAITLNGSIYLAGDNMVAQSTDGGNTWTNLFPATSGNQLFMGLATDGRFLIAAGFSPNIWVLPVPPTGLAAAETKPVKRP